MMQDGHCISTHDKKHVCALLVLLKICLGKSPLELRITPNSMKTRHHNHIDTFFSLELSITE